VPWLRILDAVLGVTELARGRGARAAPTESLEPAGRTLGQFETRLAGVVVAALKEAFDRDSRRLDLERDQLAAERARVERALRLELLRQAGDREVARLRLIAGVALVSWLGSLFFSARLGAGLGGRLLTGGGWLLLLAALATAFSAQSRVAAALAQLAESATVESRDLSSGPVGAAALWLVVVGLGLIGLAALL
jgi:hypothetical protein